jgi:hypothetical protein
MEPAVLSAEQIHVAPQLRQLRGHSPNERPQLRRTQVVSDNRIHAQSIDITLANAKKTDLRCERLLELEKLGVRPYIAEPDRGRRNWRNAAMPKGVSAVEAQAAVYRNRRRMRGEHGKALHRKRGEFVERSFAHVLDTGGMRRAHLRGRENLHKRYLIHVCGFNLSLVMRKRTGSGCSRTPMR